MLLQPPAEPMLTRVAVYSCKPIDLSDVSEKITESLPDDCTVFGILLLQADSQVAFYW